MAEVASKTVHQPEQFDWHAQHKLFVMLLSSVVVNVCMVLLLAYVLIHPAKQAYFSTSINGRTAPLYGLDEPNQSDSAVLQWANQAAIAAFSYDFATYQVQLNAASDFFTAAGWAQFLNALASSNTLEALKTKKLIISAVATSAPIILQKGVLNGSYAWRVQMPLLVTYQSASDISQQRSVVTILVTRIPTLHSPRGIGVSQFTVGPAVAAGVDV